LAGPICSYQNHRSARVAFLHLSGLLSVVAGAGACLMSAPPHRPARPMVEINDGPTRQITSASQAADG